MKGKSIILFIVLLVAILTLVSCANAKTDSLLVKDATEKREPASTDEKDPTEEQEPDNDNEWFFNEVYHWHAIDGVENEDESEYAVVDYEEHSWDSDTHLCKCGKKEQCELAFIDYNDRTLKTIVIDYGTELVLNTEIDDPQREKYIFKGWALNDTIVEQYTVQTSTTFKATYASACIVIFMANGTIVETQLVEKSKDASLPKSTPSKSGYTFANWENYTCITEDKIINAVFNPIKYNVKYLMPDGEEIGQEQLIEYGSAAVEPDVEPYWFDSENYHLYRFTNWTYKDNLDWNYSDIENDVASQFSNDSSVTPCVSIKALYRSEHHQPIILLENGTAINDTTIPVNLSIILPSGNECFLYGIDLKVSYEGISITGDSINTGSVFYDKTLTTDYNNKTKNFTLVWTSNNSGINYSSQQIIDTITFSRPNKQVTINRDNLVLQNDSSLIIASTNDAAYETMQKITPIIIIR